jgi:WXG100 family type VII secretion target
MESMSVNSGQVSALAGQIRNGARGIRSQLDTLESEVGKLRASWDGQAQQAYDEAQRKWTQSLTEMNELLERISQKTEEMSTGYVQNDNASAARFQG